VDDAEMLKSLREALAQYAPETQFLLLETHIFNARA
jgi:hypothetical protein